MYSLEFPCIGLLHTLAIFHDEYRGVDSVDASPVSAEDLRHNDALECLQALVVELNLLLQGIYFIRVSREFDCQRSGDAVDGPNEEATSDALVDAAYEVVLGGSGLDDPGLKNLVVPRRGRRLVRPDQGERAHFTWCK